MNNFKDYLNFSSNLSDNLYRLQLIALTEAKKKKEKKEKKANKDYDGDGKVESGSDEYLGSRSNAIKKAISKREGKDLKENSGLIDGRYDPELKRVVTADGRRKKMGGHLPDVLSVDFPSYGVNRFKQEFNPKNSSSSDSDLDAMRKKAEEIGGIPMPDKSSSDIIDMRKKAAEMGGITDDMINEPIPSSSGTSILPNVSHYQAYKRLRSRINFDDKEYPVRIQKKSIRDVAQDLLNPFKKNQNKLSESKEKMPTEMMVDFFVNNSTKGFEPEDAEMYTPLPPEIHKQILPHVDKAVLMIGQGGRIPEDANLPEHINDLSKAIGILDKAGHGNHPAAHFLDRIRDTINDEHMSRRR
jgi:hypothetical protein